MTTEYRLHNCTISIDQDEDYTSPREWSNVGKMVCWHRDYRLGDEQPDLSPIEWLRSMAGDHCDSPDELTADECLVILEPFYVFLPLGLYDHSGITMYVGGRHRQDSAGWDSGSVGWIYCSLPTAAAEWSAPDHKAQWDEPVYYTKKPDGSPRTLREAAIDHLTSEVETYDDYLTGNVYRYTVEHEESKEEESCGGYYGDRSCVKLDAEAVAKAFDARWEKSLAEEADYLKREAAERDDLACRGVVTI
jgi:hypothetical protein